ncbi:MAG: helix-turn-helix domain-containing protein [Rhodospirillales bacterium]
MRERKGPSAPWRWEGEGAAPEAVTPQPCTAPLLGVSRRQLSDLVNGHAGISPEMAIRLDKAFGGGARNLAPPAVRLRHGPSPKTRRPHQRATHSCARPRRVTRRPTPHASPSHCEPPLRRANPASHPSQQATPATRTIGQNVGWVSAALPIITHRWYPFGEHRGEVRRAWRVTAS